MTFLDAIAFASLQLNHSLRFGEMPGMCSILQHASACDVYVQSSFDITAFAVLTPWHLNDICVTSLAVCQFFQEYECLNDATPATWSFVLWLCLAMALAITESFRSLSGKSCRAELPPTLDFQHLSVMLTASNIIVRMVETCWNTNSCFAK